MYWYKVPLEAEAPHRGLLPPLYGGGQRYPIEAPHRGAPKKEEFGALLKKNCPS